jgi:hypothetical protein
MSRQKFDELFIKWPMPQKGRDEVERAITSSLSSMRAARKRLEEKPDSDTLQGVVTAIDTLDLWHLKGVPSVVNEVYEKLVRSHNAAVAKYNAIGMGKGKRGRRAARAKELPFTIQTAIETVDRLIAWLEDITP